MKRMEQNIPVININPLKDKIIVHKYDHKCYIYQFDYQKASDSHVVYFKYDGVGHCEDSSCMIPLADGNRLLLVDLLTQYVGTHNVELYEVDTEGQYVKSSEIFELVVKPVVNGGNVQEVHDPDLDLLYLEYKALYDKLVLKEEDLNNLITDIEYKRDHGQFDGFSPVVSTERVSDGVVINITDKNGTHVSKVNDGQEGSPGEPGFSPVATVTKNGRTSRLTVTDKNGTTSTDINDGADGYTPRKGIDYFTQSDKNQIVDEVIDRVPPYDDTEIRQDISDLQEEDLSIRQKISEIEMAKFPNVTIYGQPTINQGQISNFSSDNYCQFPFVVNFQNQRFLIDFEFSTGSDVSNQHNILDSNFGLAFAVRQNRFVVAISTNGINWDVGEGVGTHVVAPNTTYRIKMAWNGIDAFTLSYSEDGGQSYILDITKTLTLQPYPKQMYIGISFDKTHNFNGIVNLNYASLTIADKLVWQGMDDVGIATRMAIDMSNIDESGINRLYDLVKNGGYVKNTDYATTSKGGVIKGNTGYGYNTAPNGYIYPMLYSENEYKNANNYIFIGKGTLENVLAERLKTPKYELIEDITITEPVNSITRTTEPNGTPYNFKKVIIAGNFAINSTSYLVIRINRDDRWYQEGDMPYISVPPNTFYNFVEVLDVSEDIVNFKIKNNTNRSSSVAWTERAMPNSILTNGQNIKEIFIPCYRESELFLEGSRFRIFGIRA